MATPTAHSKPRAGYTEKLVISFFINQKTLLLLLTSRARVFMILYNGDIPAIPEIIFHYERRSSTWLNNQKKRRKGRKKFQHDYTMSCQSCLSLVFDIDKGFHTTWKNTTFFSLLHLGERKKKNSFFSNFLSTTAGAPEKKGGYLCESLLVKSTNNWGAKGKIKKQKEKKKRK